MPRRSCNGPHWREAAKVLWALNVLGSSDTGEVEPGGHPNRARAELSASRTRSLQEVTAALSKAASIEQVAAVTIEQIPGALEDHHAGLWLVSEDGRSLIFQCMAGEAPPVVVGQALACISIEPDRSPRLAEAVL